jgi:hypothetical protein
MDRSIAATVSNSSGRTAPPAATVRNDGVIDGVSYSFVTIEVWKVDAAGRICAVRPYYEPPDAADPYFKPPKD